MSRSVLPPKATVGDLVDLLRRSGITRTSMDKGRALTLSETATVMYTEGHFDRVPTRREILEIERTAMRKIGRMLN